MPGLETVMDAVIMCTNGTAAKSLTVDPIPIFVEGFLAGKILDGVGEVNIPSFGVCDISEQSCTPLTAAWLPGNPTVLMEMIPALAQISLCPCAMAIAEQIVGDAVGLEGVCDGPCMVVIDEPNNFTVWV